MGILTFHIDSLECVNEEIREPTVNKAVDSVPPISVIQLPMMMQCDFFKVTCIGDFHNKIISCNPNSVLAPLPQYHNCQPS